MLHRIKTNQQKNAPIINIFFDLCYCTMEVIMFLANVNNIYYMLMTNTSIVGSSLYIILQTNLVIYRHKKLNDNIYNSMRINTLLVQTAI